MKEKEVWVAYLLLILLGGLGVHKFYLGKTGMGILYIFTFGLFSIGILVDLFTIPKQVREVNAAIKGQGGQAEPAAPAAPAAE